ncbi:hypothetical protein [Nocardia sp. CC227C]|uniref:hypothetical protein n=1 Tax=Nocardia sp. CC227C TaxID=3044562 RepID=UPI00278C7AB2|nr:hypothetical protein [Nocardia sp. CC227C]
MAAAKKTAPVEVEAPKKSRWATLRDEARAQHKPKAPYIFDGCEPPVEITAPDSIERLTALLELVDRKGEVDPTRMRDLVRTVLGDAFDRVWAVIKDEPAEVLLPFIGDISDHFDADPGEEAGALPGGA